MHTHMKFDSPGHQCDLSERSLIAGDLKPQPIHCLPRGVREVRDGLALMPTQGWAFPETGGTDLGIMAGTYPHLG